MLLMGIYKMLLVYLDIATTNMTQSLELSNGINFTLNIKYAPRLTS